MWVPVWVTVLEVVFYYYFQEWYGGVAPSCTGEPTCYE